MRSDVAMRDAWESCVVFNSTHPIGTDVIYHPVIDSDVGVRQTKTRSVAWVLPSGEPVVLVEGESGGVSLRSIKAVTNE